MSKHELPPLESYPKEVMAEWIRERFYFGRSAEQAHRDLDRIKWQQTTKKALDLMDDSCRRLKEGVSGKAWWAAQNDFDKAQKMQDDAYAEYRAKWGDE